MLSLQICLIEGRRKNATKVIDNEYYAIVVPHDPGTARLYCAGTKWCIASKNVGPRDDEWLVSFEDYNRAGYEIAVIINKKLDSRKNPLAKVALVYDIEEGTFDWFDAQNEPTTADAVISFMKKMLSRDVHAWSAVVHALHSLMLRMKQKSTSA